MSKVKTIFVFEDLAVDEDEITLTNIMGLFGIWWRMIRRLLKTRGSYKNNLVVINQK